MSRVAKAPIQIPTGVEVKIEGQNIAIKGGKGTLTLDIHADVAVTQADNVITLAPVATNWAMAGTFRALINNMVTGVSAGYEKKLLLQGVGYRAKAAGKTINLTIGFSHPVDYELPEGITAATPTQTEIVISGADKQRVGQVAAEIRAYRPPEPYKGKGIRYSDEHVRRKEAKKK